MRSLFIAVIVIGVTIIIYVVSKDNLDEAPAYIEQVVEISIPKIENKPVINLPIPVIEENIAVNEVVISEYIEDIPESVEEFSQLPKPDPLPALDESDGLIEMIVKSLADTEQFSRLIIFKSIIRHIVVNIDNLTASKLPQKFRFYQPVGGSFKVIKQDREDDKGILDPQNFSRYSAYTRAIETLDLKELSDIYLKYYPLFQEAYEELGYPDKEFNDRFVEVINHLLLTPTVIYPIELKQPKVFYTFSDPVLEALSSGQKLMIRIGPDNSSVIRKRLIELRQLITNII